MKRLVPIAVAVAASACQPGPAADAAPAVEITNLTCRPTPNGRNVTACFASFAATTDDRLVSISSPNADDVQVHSVRTDIGMMVMREMEDGLALPAGETIQLRPGGDHIMVIGAHTPLAEGDRLSLAFTFERAGEVGVRATVGQPALDGEDGGHH